MSNPVNEALSKESLDALNQAVFSFLSKGGGLPAGVPTSLVQTELAALTGHFDVTVANLFKASCDHHQLDVAAASLDPALVKPMQPVVGASQGLAGMDTRLGKSKGFSARLLLRSVAESTTPVSQTALTSIAGSLVAGLGQAAPNVLIRNALRELAQAVTSLDSNAYRLVVELRRATAHEPASLEFMTFLDQSLLGSLMTNEYDERSMHLFIAFDLAEPEFTNHLAVFLKDRLEAKVDFEDDQAENLLLLLLDTDDQLTGFKSKLMKGIQADLEVSDSVSMALGVGRAHLQNSSCAKYFNQMDATVLAEGLKSRQDFELLSGFPGIDLERLDKRKFGVEALGGCFSSDLGL